jgi:hypothetical protein
LVGNTISQELNYLYDDKPAELVAVEQPEHWAVMPDGEGFSYYSIDSAETSTTTTSFALEFVGEGAEIEEAAVTWSGATEGQVLQKSIYTDTQGSRTNPMGR